ncbi:hypothetical protein AAMO2058_000936800, partial [Amorphochlora amoebiformis]
MWVGSSLQHAISGDPPAGDPERTERDMTIDTDGGTTKGKRVFISFLWLHNSVFMGLRIVIFAARGGEDATPVGILCIGRRSSMVHIPEVHSIISSTLKDAGLNAHTSWMKDPSFGMSVNAECKKVHNVDEHYICLDNFPPKDRPCIVYDFGIRDRPKFGIQMYDEFKCQVYAFDPSPVSVEWFTKDEEGRMLADKSYYHFYPYGAGGVDGNITLYEYSWQQVSNIHLPTTVSDDCENHGDGCKLIDHKAGLFKLPVKTLKTIMRDLNHTHVDILKLDIEGSEWGFMENILDNGCPPVDQISVEYHHFSFDM